VAVSNLPRFVLVTAGRRAQGTGHRAQGTGHRAQSTEHRAQGTGHRAKRRRGDEETKGPQDSIAGQGRGFRKTMDLKPCQGSGTV